jgi:hypothetical protein
MGKVQKLGVWVLHILTQDNKNQRVAICGSLIACHLLLINNINLFCPQLSLATKNGASTAECYCQQLRHLEEAIQQTCLGQRHRVILQYDTA